MDLVHKSVLAACDEDDGVKDGIIGDPVVASGTLPLCYASPAAPLAINVQAKPSASLPQKDLRTCVNSAGVKLFPSGHALGSETDEWERLGEQPVKFSAPPHQPLKSRNYQVSEQFLRYLTFEKSPGELNYDPLKFNFDRDPAKLARARAIYDATSVDLSAFKAHGGKMLIWHGWADGGIPAPASIDYVSSRP